MCRYPISLANDRYIINNVRLLSYPLVAAIVVNAIIILLFRGSSLVYAVIPFNVAYILSVAWLAKVAYSWFMAVITILLTVFPVGILVIMFLAYSRAAKEIKELGYKTGFSGNLEQN